MFPCACRLDGLLLTHSAHSQYKHNLIAGGTFSNRNSCISPVRPIDLHTFILLPIFSVEWTLTIICQITKLSSGFLTRISKILILIILSGKIFYLLYVCSLLCREAWSQCGNASKEESMRMYIEELQRVS